MELASPWARMSTALVSSVRRLRPFDHIDVPAVSALEEPDRRQFGAKPGQLAHELHTRPTALTGEFGRSSAPHAPG